MSGGLATLRAMHKPFVMSGGNSETGVSLLCRKGDGTTEQRQVPTSHTVFSHLRVRHCVSSEPDSQHSSVADARGADGNRYPLVVSHLITSVAGFQWMIFAARKITGGGNPRTMQNKRTACALESRSWSKMRLEANLQPEQSSSTSVSANYRPPITNLDFQLHTSQLNPNLSASRSPATQSSVQTFTAGASNPDCGRSVTLRVRLMSSDIETRDTFSIGLECRWWKRSPKKDLYSWSTSAVCRSSPRTPPLTASLSSAKAPVKTSRLSMSFPYAWERSSATSLFDDTAAKFPASRRPYALFPRKGWGNRRARDSSVYQWAFCLIVSGTASSTKALVFGSKFGHECTHLFQIHPGTSQILVVLGKKQPQKHYSIRTG